MKATLSNGDNDISTYAPLFSEVLKGSNLRKIAEALMSAIPALDPDEVMKPVILEGEIPSPAHWLSLCRHALAQRSGQVLTPL